MADRQQQRRTGDDHGGLFDGIGEEYLNRALEERPEASNRTIAEDTGLPVDHVAFFRRNHQQQQDAALREEVLGSQRESADAGDTGTGQDVSNPLRRSPRRRVPRPLPAAGRPPHRRDVSHRN